jgi:hypothetical protein
MLCFRFFCSTMDRTLMLCSRIVVLLWIEHLCYVLEFFAYYQEKKYVVSKFFSISHHELADALSLGIKSVIR